MSQRKDVTKKKALSYRSTDGAVQTWIHDDLVDCRCTQPRLASSACSRLFPGATFSADRSADELGVKSPWIVQRTRRTAARYGL